MCTTFFEEFTSKARKLVCRGVLLGTFHSATICHSHNTDRERQRDGFRPWERYGFPATQRIMWNSTCLLEPKSRNVLGGCSLVSLSGVCNVISFCFCYLDFLQTVSKDFCLWAGLWLCYLRIPLSETPVKIWFLSSLASINGRDCASQGWRRWQHLL